MKSLLELPRATFAILVLNIAIFILVEVFEELRPVLSLYYFDHPNFQPYQILSHVFMHGGFAHLFFNMYALVIFGSVIEQVIGTKKYIVLYFVAAMGAFALQLGNTWYSLKDVTPETMEIIQSQGYQALQEGKNFVDETLASINLEYNISLVGASGAIMGLLMAFAIIFPNAKMQIIFVPIDIKAKYFMPFYMLVELFLGVSNFQWDNIGHFAHLGGAIFGALLVWIWKRNISTPWYE